MKTFEQFCLTESTKYQYDEKTGVISISSEGKGPRDTKISGDFLSGVDFKYKGTNYIVSAEKDDFYFQVTDWDRESNQLLEIEITQFPKDLTITDEDGNPAPKSLITQEFVSKVIEFIKDNGEDKL